MDQPSSIRLGSSLLVPCVQEMVKNNNSMTTVPQRYQQNPEQDKLTIVSDSISAIPVVDMKKLLSKESMDSEPELAKLDSACRNWGFFQLINHGVESCLVEKVKLEIRDFFDLSIEENKKYWQTGQEVEGFGQAFLVSEEQKLDWGDLFFMITQPPRFRKPNLFPKLPLHFRDTLDNYSSELKKLALAILEKMVKALNMKDEEMKEFFGDGTQSMRMNYYPPCPQPELVNGLTPHSDSVGLTILLQLNQVEGLQVKKAGRWCPVKRLPDAFIVNIGDVLEIITNGEYPSIEHRAVVNSKQEKLSIATFYNPKFEGEVGPAKSLISEGTPARFKRITFEEYFKGLFTRQLEGKAYRDAMKIYATSFVPFS